MEEFKPIEFQQARDFSRKMNTTFEFIRQNFKSLGKAILYIAGPPVLTASLLIGFFFSEFITLSEGLQSSGDAEQLGNYFLSVSFWLQVSLLFVLVFISYVISIATINNYIILYHEKKTNKIEVAEVWSRVQNTFWTYLGTTFLFFIALLLAYIALLIPVFILGAISPFLIFFGFMFFAVAFVFLLISSYLTYFVQLYERKNFFDALVRSYKLINNGKWWSTFGLLFILQLIMGISSYIFMIPYYFVMFTYGLHSVSGESPLQIPDSLYIVAFVCFTLYYMAQMLLSALPNVGIAFQYFNLVELKEARGLMSQIETIGQNDSGPRPEEHF